MTKKKGRSAKPAFTLSALRKEFESFNEADVLQLVHRIFLMRFDSVADLRELAKFIFERAIRAAREDRKKLAVLTRRLDDRLPKFSTEQTTSLATRVTVGTCMAEICRVSLSQAQADMATYSGDSTSTASGAPLDENMRPCDECSACPSPDTSNSTATATSPVPATEPMDASSHTQADTDPSPARGSPESMTTATATATGDASSRASPAPVLADVPQSSAAAVATAAAAAAAQALAAAPQAVIPPPAARKAPLAKPPLTPPQRLHAVDAFSACLYTQDMVTEHFIHSILDNLRYRACAWPAPARHAAVLSVCNMFTYCGMRLETLGTLCHVMPDFHTYLSCLARTPDTPVHVTAAITEIQQLRSNSWKAFTVVAPQATSMEFTEVSVTSNAMLPGPA